ncbi:MAG: GGDEF domain-containing response regulator [Desulfobacca sp.]|uniref:GGDEF domain-containing response regulator n=1 Tax=Desulfobacca sp. TaxID=2067990 RepID=UPI00404A1CF1
MKSPLLLSPEPMNILIVEDSPTQAERLRYILEREGLAVTWAHHGKEALALLENFQPDLIISDIVMPHMDGFELCQHIKKEKRWQHIPVILLTSLTSIEDVMHGLKCGADNFITKPYDEYLLLRRIEFILLNNKGTKKVSQDEKGIEIIFGGQKHYINSNPGQILSLLISTFESAVAKNQKLQAANLELAKAKALLEKQAEELQALSLQDSLTGLYNRRGFMTLGEHQLKLACRNRTQLILLFIDLDDLKHINDTFGHAMGDRAILATAQILQTTYRQSDIIARLGGDEFAVLQICKAEDANGILQERLEQNIKEYNALAEHPFTLSLSSGFAHFDPSRPQDLEDLLAQADAKMYEQKYAKKVQRYKAGDGESKPANVAANLRLV